MELSEQAKKLFEESRERLRRFRVGIQGLPENPVHNVEIEEGDSLVIRWGHRGFGETSIYMQDGKLMIDDECMGRAFVKAVLCKLVDEAVLTSELASCERQE